MKRNLLGKTWIYEYTPVPPKIVCRIFGVRASTEGSRGHWKMLQADVFWEKFSLEGFGYEGSRMYSADSELPCFWYGYYNLGGIFQVKWYRILKCNLAGWSENTEKYWH